MVEIDGSHGEGGGQMLRTSLSLSSLTQQPFRMVNVRAGREKPGLRPQHLAAVRAVAQVCDAVVSGDAVNSLQLEFHPGALRAGSFTVNVAERQRSAGAVTLIAHALLPPVLFAPASSTVTLQGGTHVPFSPPFEHFDRVFLHALQRFGVDARARLVSAGWMPQGGGELRLSVQPGDGLKSVTIVERGEVRRVECTAVLSKLKPHIGVRQRDRMLERLRAAGMSKFKAEVVNHDSPGEGTMSFILLEHDLRAGFSALGALGKPSEKVADEAARAALKFLGSDAPIEPCLADQLLVYCALARGRSEFRTSELTPHCVTNMDVISQFLPVKFEVQGEPGTAATIAVEGVGCLVA